MGTLWEKNLPKKCITMPKKLKGVLVSSGIVCYAEKKKKPFWSSSLGLMAQFDTIEVELL